jgi:peptidyl-prolyl cis-trans isomerase A (cyclophilin A)
MPRSLPSTAIQEEFSMPAKRFQLAHAIVLAALVALCIPVANAATTVRMMTTLGLIDIQLYDTATPLTVANFLQYVNSGAYTNSMIHRSVPGFVIQGGGFIWSDTSPVAAIPTAAPVQNEYSASRSNVRGTIAMAKLGTDPNSATSQWFFNLANNSANLDSQNGGFTVFGRVIGNGMSVVDAIAALPVRDANGSNPSGPFGALPLVTLPTNGVITKPNLVLVTSATAAPATGLTDSDRVFAYLEAIYPQYLAPANPLSTPTAYSASAAGYYYRYYAATNAFIASKPDSAGVGLYYYGPVSGNTIVYLGTLASWLTLATAAGY